MERCRFYLVESEKSAATAEKYLRDLRAFAAWIKGAELCRILRRHAAERNITEGSIFISRKGTPVNRSTILRMFKKLCGEAGLNGKKCSPTTCAICSPEPSVRRRRISCVLRTF